MQRLAKLPSQLPLVFLFVFSWLVLWFFPWQQRIQLAYPWLSIFLALILFILPGAALYALICSRFQPTTDHFTFGFAFSSLILALVASIGRLLQWPFALVQQIFMVFGLVSGTIWVSRISLRELLLESRNLKNLNFLPIVLLVVLAALMTIPRIINDDDLAYLARVANWQAMPVMNFKDVYFGAQQLDMVRFWIMSAPYSQAFLSKVSGLPAIVLLSGYYDPFLAALSVLSIYQLARAFKLSPALANTAIAAQIAFLALLWPYQHPGYNFFSQLSADKSTASFILLPVFLQAVLSALDGTRGSRTLVLLTVFSLSFMHPVILAFSLFIAGLMLLLGVQRTDLSKRAVLFGMFALAILPHIVLRFLPSEAQASIPFDPQSISQSRGIENLIRLWGDSGMYGLNPDTLAMSLPFEEKIPLPSAILDWGWLLLPVITAGVALIHFRQNELARYFLSAFLLVAAALIPFTGWMMGMVVSAWMLERTAWVYPFGVGIAFMFSLFPNQKRLPLVAWGISIAVIVLMMFTLQLPNFARMERVAQRSRELAQVGSFLDQRIAAEFGIAVGSEKLNDFIPAISWKAKVISYRVNDPSYPYFYSEAERMQRYLDRQAILSPHEEIEHRLELLQKYKIRYIVLESADEKIIQMLVDFSPEQFKLHRMGSFIVVEVQ